MHTTIPTQDNIIKSHIGRENIGTFRVLGTGPGVWHVPLFAPFLGLHRWKARAPALRVPSFLGSDLPTVTAATGGYCGRCTRMSKGSAWGSRGWLLRRGGVRYETQRKNSALPHFLLTVVWKAGVSYLVYRRTNWGLLQSEVTCPKLLSLQW